MSEPSYAIKVAEGLGNMLEQHWAKESGSIMPVRSNRASEAAHPCLAYLCFQRLHWDKGEAIDPGLARIFWEGRLNGDIVLKLLREAGVRIAQEEVPFPPNTWQIGGRIDCTVALDEKSKPVPAEVKGLSRWNFEKFCVEALADPPPDQWYWRLWHGQFQLYLFLYELERSRTKLEQGVYIISIRNTAILKFFPVYLDYDYVEKILDRLEVVNEHIAQNAIADKTPGIWCDRCGYKGICKPPVTFAADVFLANDEEIEKLLVERASLKEGAERFEVVDELLKNAHRAKNVGTYLYEGGTIKVSRYSSSVYSVPDDIKEQYKQQAERTRIAITPIKPSEVAADG